MRLAGLKKTSFVDYPGLVSSVIFTQGCNFRCPYCHNPTLLLESGASILDSEEVLSYLDSRIGKIDGVVISGGEPTLQEDLDSYLRTIRAMGFKTKIDTNGSRPKVLERLLESRLVDFVALDLKVPLSSYKRLSPKDFSSQVRRSLESLKRFKSFEVRTTLVPGLLNVRSLLEMADLVGAESPWIWQQFSPKICLDKSFEQITPHSLLTLESLLDIVSPVVPRISLRNI